MIGVMKAMRVRRTAAGVAVLSVALAACSGEDPAPTQSPPATSSGVAVV